MIVIMVMGSLLIIKDGLFSKGCIGIRRLYVLRFLISLREGGREEVFCFFIYFWIFLGYLCMNFL